MQRAKLFERILALGARANGGDAGLVPEIVIGPKQTIDTLPLPKSYKDAVTGPYRKYWIRAVAEELANLRNYKVWRKEPLPKDAQPIRGKFVWKWKGDENNYLLKAKARFTLQGCCQVKYIHYKKTYAPVAYATTLRVALKLGVDLDYCIDVTDLKAAYLTAFLEPDLTLFMEPPPGVEVERGFGLRLIRALYGSMQGAQRLDVLKHKVLESLGFIRMSSETSVYYTPLSSDL